MRPEEPRPSDLPADAVHSRVARFDAIDALAGACSPRALRALALGAVLAPPIATLIYVAAFGVNGPHFDHLTTAEIFERWDTGQFTFEYVFRQYNEHRKAVPRLVQLGLGLLTRNSNRAEMFLQWFLLSVTSTVLFLAFKRDTRTSGPRALLAFAPIGALLVSVRQYEILLVGDGLLTYLSLVFFATGLWLLWREDRGTTPFVFAIVAAALASFSQGNGPLIWPIGLLLLLADARLRVRRGVVIRLTAWLLAGIVALGFYAHGYVSPIKTNIVELLRAPSAAGGYFLAVCGGSLAPEMRGAVAAGILIVLLEALVLLAVLRDFWQHDRRPPFGVWLVIGSVISITMIAVNRSWIGIGQALTPRYSTYSSLAPIGLYWCVLVRRDVWRLGPSLTTALVTLLVFGWLAGTLDGWIAGPKQRDWHRWHAYLVYTAKQQPLALLATELYPNALHARAYSAMLERLKLNVFAEDPVSPAKLMPGARPPFGVDAIHPTPAPGTARIDVSDDQGVTLTGWALDAASRRPAHAVFVTVDGTIHFPALTQVRRTPAGADDPATARSGFKASFSAAALPLGVHQLALTIVEADRKHVFVTETFLEVHRR